MVNLPGPFPGGVPGDSADVEWAIGVDVGGTKIAAGVVDEKGRIAHSVRRPSPKDDPLALQMAIIEVVEDLRLHFDVAAVGLGGAGFVDADCQRFYFAPHLQWGDGPVADQLADALDVPVVVENDGNAAAWAEYRFGAGVGVPHQLMVALGTGIGGALILDGEIYRGGHGAAGEVGHIGLVPHGSLCHCGRRGCFEEYASGNALQRQARLAASEGRAPGILRATGGVVEAITGPLVTRLAHEGDPDAALLFTELGDWLGIGIATLVAVLDPSIVLLGGGVSEAGGVLLDPARRALAREITGLDHRPGPELRLAALGNDAGMIGAADLARRRV